MEIGAPEARKIRAESYFTTNMSVERAKRERNILYHKYMKGFYGKCVRVSACAKCDREMILFSRRQC